MQLRDEMNKEIEAVLEDILSKKYPIEQGVPELTERLLRLIGSGKSQNYESPEYALTFLQSSLRNIKTILSLRLNNPVITICQKIVDKISEYSQDPSTSIYGDILNYHFLSERTRQEYLVNGANLKKSTYYRTLDVAENKLGDYFVDLLDSSPSCVTKFLNLLQSEGNSHCSEREIKEIIERVV